MAPSVERFVGSVLGQSLGDALGFPVEGMGPGACSAYAGQLRLGRSPEDMGRGGFEFGQYTDDSQLAREWIVSFVERGRFDPADFAARLARQFGEGLIVGRGRATEQAAQRLLSGVSWETAGTPAPSAGNGTAMRAGPVGLAFWNDPEALVGAAHDQGRITHQDPRCSAGSAVIARAVSLALVDGPVEPVAFCGELARVAERFDASFAGFLRELPGWLSMPPNVAAGHIAPLGQDPGMSDHWRGISPFVVGSVLWSLYAFLSWPDDYWQAVCTAIEPGGDVDTTAAMTGAISGARVGVGGLPAELVARVNDQGEWGAEALAQLATRLHALVTGGR